jgi:carboxylate-amine ligase
VVAAVTEVVRALAEGRLSRRDPAADPPTEVLAALLEATTLRADEAPVEIPGLLRILGLGSDSRTAGDVWRDLLDRYPPDDPAREWTGSLWSILRDGPLSRRLVASLGDRPDRARLRDVYGRLCECLDRNEAFSLR